MPRYSLLCSLADGRFLRWVSSTKTLQLHERIDDASCFLVNDNEATIELRPAAAVSTVAGTSNDGKEGSGECSACYGKGERFAMEGYDGEDDGPEDYKIVECLKCGGTGRGVTERRWRVDVATGERLAVATLVVDAAATDVVVLRGPEQLPSFHVAELVRKGVTIVPSLLSQATIAHLKSRFTAMQGAEYEGRAQRIAHRGQVVELGRSVPTDSPRISLHSVVKDTPVVARVSAHPVTLAIARAYMGTHALRLAHSPIVSVLKPQDGRLGPGGGWHADYPYHRQYFPAPAFPSGSSLGLQCNVCIDEFTTLNGATHISAGSHRRLGRPPSSWKDRDEPEGTAQAVCAPGSVVIYDSRTWHRQGTNRSTTDRCALLNAVVPSFVMPMLADTNRDLKEMQERVKQEPAWREALTSRELTDMDRLMAFRVQGNAMEVEVAPRNTRKIKARM